MFRLSACILLVIITFSVVHSVLITQEYGDRIEGDIALYSRTQITTPTAEPTIHGVVFDWVGKNQTFTQVIFEMNDYSFSSFGERREFVPPFLHSIVAFFINIETDYLLVTMTVFGFPDRTHIDVHPWDSHKSLEPIEKTVTTRK